MLRRIFTHSLFVATFCGLIVSGCTEKESPVHQLNIPDLGSQTTGEPNLSVSPNGERLSLSWVKETSDTTAELWHASLTSDDLSKGSWQRPERLITGDNWFVNWADFPSIQTDNQGVVLAHWLQKREGGTYAYNVNLMRKQDHSGWSDPIVPHKDGTATEHGFVSMAPLPGENYLAVWLDGRNTAQQDPPNAMTVRSAEITPDGTVSYAREIDGRVCDCCQTDAVSFNGAIIAAYRNRTTAEIRDIALSVYWPKSHEWEELGILWPDHWQIGGCPVNGPALAANKDYAAMAWYTQSDDMPRVSLGLITPNMTIHEPFQRPVHIDQGTPLGRVDVSTATIQDQSGFVVTWVEKTGEDTAAIMARFVEIDGTAHQPLTVSPIDPSRSSGFPRSAVFQDQLVLGYTKVLSNASATKIATSRLPLDELVDEKSSSEAIAIDHSSEH
jgi:hypothetical protein